MPSENAFTYRLYMTCVALYLIQFKVGAHLNSLGVELVGPSDLQHVAVPWSIRVVLASPASMSTLI